MNWEIVTEPQCPVPGPKGEICSGAEGHDPIPDSWGPGEHWCTDFANGEISGIYTWSAATSMSADRRAQLASRCDRGHFLGPAYYTCNARSCREREAREFDESVRDAWYRS